MEGYILNASINTAGESVLPPNTPNLSRMEHRDQIPVLYLSDGTPVFEAWFYFENAWWVLTKVRDARWPPSVRSFGSVTELQRMLRQ